VCCYSECGSFSDSCSVSSSLGFTKLRKCLNVPLAGHGTAMFRKVKENDTLVIPKSSHHDFLCRLLPLELLRPCRRGVTPFQGLILCFQIVNICPCFIPYYQIGKRNVSSLASNASSRSEQTSTLLFFNLGVNCRGTHFAHTFRYPKSSTIFCMAL
jgi:hypothetical protein